MFSIMMALPKRRLPAPWNLAMLLKQSWKIIWHTKLGTILEFSHRGVMTFASSGFLEIRGTWSLVLWIATAFAHPRELDGGAGSKLSWRTTRLRTRASMLYKKDAEACLCSHLALCPPLSQLGVSSQLKKAFITSVISTSWGGERRWGPETHREGN